MMSLTRMIVNIVSRLAKRIQPHATCVKIYGKETAKKIGMRLQQLADAETLEDLRNAPGRLHELHGDKKGVFSFDLQHPLRLLFHPDQEENCYDGNSIIWEKVYCVLVISIEDTH